MLIWSIVNGLIVLMIVAMALSILYFLIQYLIVFKIIDRGDKAKKDFMDEWEKW